MKFTAFAYLAAVATLATATPLNKRANYSGRVVPLGETTGSLASCGQQYVEGSRLVSVASDLLPNCAQRSITITCGGRTTTAEVADKCPGCGHDSIDVSAAVYSSLGGGPISGLEGCTWSF